MLRIHQIINKLNFLALNKKCRIMNFRTWLKKVWTAIFKFCDRANLSRRLDVFGDSRENSESLAIKTAGCVALNSNPRAKRIKRKLTYDITLIFCILANELDSLISAFTSPVPYNILTDYNSKKQKKENAKDTESALENLELKGPVFREFTIHIFQSINFLQNI